MKLNTQDTEEEQTTYCVERRSALAGPMQLIFKFITGLRDGRSVSTDLVKKHLLIRLKGLQITLFTHFSACNHVTLWLSVDK